MQSGLCYDTFMLLCECLASLEALHFSFVSLLEEISFNWHFYIYINSFKTLK